MEMEMNALGPKGGVDGGRNLERVRVWSKWEKGKGKPNKREDEKKQGEILGEI